MDRPKQITIFRAAEWDVEEAVMGVTDARQVLERHPSEWFASRTAAQEALEARLRARPAQAKRRA